MAIWKIDVTPEAANARAQGTMVSHVGIEITEIGPDFLTARMPVDERTRQPMGILHGGASVVLSETVASLAATFCVDPATSMCVGMEINANHIRPVAKGHVTGTARPAHLGRTSQIWEVRIVDEAGKLVCISRVTMAVVPKPAA